jgi:hypothetical protein
VTRDQLITVLLALSSPANLAARHHSKTRGPSMPPKKREPAPKVKNKKTPLKKQKATTPPKEEQPQDQSKPKRRCRSTICPDPENMNIKVIDPGGEITDETAMAIARILLRMTSGELKFSQPSEE